MLTKMWLQASAQLSNAPTPNSRPGHLKTPSYSDSLDTNESDNAISQSDPVIFSVLCMFDHTSSESGLLSFRKNEILDVVKCTDGGWWAAMRKGESILGWIPQTFVHPLSQQMTERLRGIREELRGAEFKRVEQCYSEQNNVPLSLTPIPESTSVRFHAISVISLSNPIQGHGHSEESLDTQNLNDPPQYLLPRTGTTSTHNRLTRSVTVLTPSQSKGTDDSRFQLGSASIQGPRRAPVMVDEDVTLSRISTLIRSNNFKQIDNLIPSYPFRALSNASYKQGQEGKVPKKFTAAGGISFGAISGTINKEVRKEEGQGKFAEAGVFRAISVATGKEVRKDKVQGKFTEAGGISFGAISGAIKREFQIAPGEVRHAGGPVINIGPENTPGYLRPQYADQLSVDDKGNVRVGSLPSLFEFLTTDPGASDTTSELGIARTIYVGDTDRVSRTSPIQNFYECIPHYVPNLYDR
jgi:SH3 domain